MQLPLFSIATTNTACLMRLKVFLFHSLILASDVHTASDQTFTFIFRDADIFYETNHS